MKINEHLLIFAAGLYVWFVALTYVVNYETIDVHYCANAHHIVRVACTLIEVNILHAQSITFDQRRVREMKREGVRNMYRISHINAVRHQSHQSDWHAQWTLCNQ